jgi:epsilon-lactone hydrolase
MSLDISPPLLRVGMRALAWSLFIGNADLPRARRRLNLLSSPIMRVPAGVSIESAELDGVPTEVITSSDPGSRVVLYLHGGVFTLCGPRTHRAITGHLAAAIPATVYVPDYRLAPEHPYPAAVEDSLRVYRSLLARGISAARIAVVGDSAGGCLALELALQARKENLPAPAVLGLICPMVDLTDTSSGLHPRNNREPVLSPTLITRSLDAYLPSHLRHTASPLYRDLSNLPPIVLHSAGEDPLEGDAARLAENLHKAGVPLQHYDRTGMWHAFHLLSTVLAPAREALDALTDALTTATNGRRE